MVEKQTQPLVKGVTLCLNAKKSAGKIFLLPVDDIHPSPYQARTSFDEAELAGLAQSIRENGLLQPITVRKAENGYELVAGGAASPGL